VYDRVKASRRFLCAAFANGPANQFGQFAPFSNRRFWRRALCYPPAPMTEPDLRFPAPAGGTLAAALRVQLPERSWSEVRRLCERGKVTVDGKVEVDPARRLNAGQTVELRSAARVPAPPAPPGFRVVHEDAHLIVIEKPAGVTSVPYERKDTGTALDLIRDHWRGQHRKATATPLYTVHRIDKDTSGLLCFAKTRLAERGMHTIFQRHLAEREYLAVAEGRVESARIESQLIADRGDGIRGSVRRPQDREEGQHAVTYVEAIEHLPAATLCRVRLETGRTHQIRIHLSERGHPLVGETVYIRDLLRRGERPLPAERLMLHAATLGFVHPVTTVPISFRAEPPPDFVAILDRLRR
jgi:23S rRNA pseudouridine1911/1915/1917 synthase